MRGRGPGDTETRGHGDAETRDVRNRERGYSVGISTHATKSIAREIVSESG